MAKNARGEEIVKRKANAFISKSVDPRTVLFNAPCGMVVRHAEDNAFTVYGLSEETLSALAELGSGPFQIIIDTIDSSTVEF